MTTTECINIFDQLVAAGGGVAIVSAQSPGNDRPHGWWVIRIVKGLEVATDPDAAWYHHKRKWFSPWRDNLSRNEGKAAALEAAKIWIAEQYGEKGPWKRNRHGDYVPERIAKNHPLRKRPS